MLPHEIDPESGARMVGGEIPDWSEPAASPSAALGALVAAAARDLPTDARILLAGMPAVSLGAHLPAGAAAHRLVRGLPDARALTGSAEMAAGGVIAGGLDRLAAQGDTFDLVVAVGGPEATCSPDSTVADATDWVRLVLGLAGDSGRVVASLSNPTGMDRFLDIAVPDPASGWSVTDAVDGAPTAPPTPARLAELDDVEVLAAWPDAAAPSVVLTAGDLTDASGPAQAAVASLAARAEGRTALRDVWATAERLLDAGLGLPLAPAWVVTRHVALPASALPHPAGSRLLESELRRAVAGPGRERLRELVEAYAAWPQAPSDVRDVLVRPDGGLAALGEDRDGRATEAGHADPVDPDDHSGHTAAVRHGLSGFAQRVCADGAAGLWSAPTTDDVVRDLLAMAGVEGSAAPTAELDSRPAPTSRSAEANRLHDAEAALDETRRKVSWLEGTLRARDRRIRTLERSIAIESSTAYKVVHQLGRPVPALKRRARSFLDRHSGA
ncbi:hypothetical protein [Knoellia subterranea]|uniref:Uncharacterized protein n=1 Tax=Knoellia subterranea KCTC 19937 TaxID=1385521 RepID=A0A0A0JJI2_9MICO|nr:hypothetical protein [Knoellia subterranea]KGN36929.1 hypothetical protein N803_16065 [Knoellia subterranea KCTC 19937]